MVFRDVRGDFDVETILPIIVQIVTGILGGQAVGAVLQQVAMTQLTKIISGAVGGVAGGTLLGTLLGGAAGTEPAAGGALSLISRSSRPVTTESPSSMNPRRRAIVLAVAG